MSPINSNSSDREFEAIHRAQRAHEPSMEEILASIRNIIADDPAKGAAPKAPQPAPTPTPQIVYSKDARRAARRCLRTVRAPRRERADGRLAPAASRRSRARRRCGRAQRGAVAVARGERSGRFVLRGLVGQSRCSQRRARRQHGARHAAADGQGMAGRQPSGDGRAAGPGGNSAGRARAEIGSRLASRVDFDRDDAFIAPVALAPAASVAHASARKAAA